MKHEVHKGEVELSRDGVHVFTIDRFDDRFEITFTDTNTYCSNELSMDKIKDVYKKLGELINN